MADPLTALPRRPLRARPPLPRFGDIRALLTALLFLGMLGFSLFWVAPVLVTDWQARSTAVRVKGGDLTDGHCSSKFFIEDCDVTLTAPVVSAQGGRGSISRTVHYVFASFEGGDFTAAVVADPQHPEWLTTDLGLDRFWNRVVSLALESALLGTLIVFSARGFVRSLRAARYWSKAELFPVPLQLVGLQRTRAYTAKWTLRAENGPTMWWYPPRRFQPFVLGPANRVLGLTTKDGRSIMPLDAGLRWVKLSAQEREAALAARNA